MPIVRSIEQLRGGTALVGVDDADPVELPLEALIAHNLHKSRQIDAVRWATITYEGRNRVAVRRALDFLAKRRRTRAQLVTRLGELEYTEPEIDRALARVEELGYLDDGAWARAYISQPRTRGRGRAVLARELKEKGIGPADLESALESHDDHEEAIAAVRKRTRALRRLEPAVRERRLYAFMQRRGFKHDTIRSALAAVAEQDAVAAELTTG